MFTTSALALLGFVAASAFVAASGAVFRPGRWYDRLDKPSWTPPRWVFPAVWSVLYLAMAVAGWLVWRKVGLAPLPFALYAVQLALNGAWSAIFFGLRRPDLAFLDIVLLWLAVVATAIVFARIDGIAAALLVPYVAWVSAAGALNWSVWRRNRDRLVLA